MVHEMLTLPDVLKRRCRGRTAHYQDIKEGLFTRPVKLGKRAVAWPALEVDAVMAARVAGASETRIRDLVSNLEAGRKIMS